jgi:hypothetical protein
VSLVETLDMASEIKSAAAGVHLLAQQGEGLDLDTLRARTAALQALLAEAARLQRKAQLVQVRGAALLTPVVVETASFAGFGRVGNLSARGMSVKGQFTLPHQRSVSVHFSSDIRLEGTIASSEFEELHIEFERPIDVQDVLSGISGGADGLKPCRPARLSTTCPGELVVGTSRLPARVRDVSQQGLKVVTAPVHCGQEVAVRLGELGEERKAVVRWTRSGLTGLSFARRLSFEELSRFGRWPLD